MASPPSPPPSPPQSQQHPNVHITYAGTYQGDDFRLPAVAPNAKISGSAVRILHPHTSTHSYVEGEDSYPHHLSILPTYMNVEGGDSYPHHTSILPTHLNVGGGDSYPHQVSAWPVHPTYLNVEGGDYYPPQVHVWPQLGDPRYQNSHHARICEGHAAPIPPKAFGWNLESDEAQKVPQMRLEHHFALANDLSGPLDDLLQLGGPQNQNSHHASICEGHDAPRPPKGQSFECDDTPKLPQTSLEHGIASANALSGPPIDFLQLGGPQNQNSHHASVCEGHGVPRPPKASFGQNFECDGTPKSPQVHLEHNFALANALSGPQNEFPQLKGTQTQNSRDTSVFEGHDTLKSSNMLGKHDFECANPALLFFFFKT